MAGPEPDQIATLEEFEELIRALYRPGADVSRIQAVLQKYQRSQQGWQLADQLLQSQDPHVRFFGALTFTVKINNDWDSLGAPDTVALLDRLLQWLVRLADAREGTLVLRKLCSTLVAYFLRPSVNWDHCVRHIVCCMRSGDVLSSETVSSTGTLGDVLSNLNTLKVTIVLWFAAALVEEVGKVNPNSVQTHHYHNKVARNLDDTVGLFQQLLARERANLITHSSVDKELSDEAIKCFQAWVLYAHRIYTNKGFQQGLNNLRSVIPLVLHKFTTEGLSEVILEFFTDVLVNFPAFFEPQHLASLATVLSGACAQQSVLALKAGDFDEDAQDFSRLLFAYGDAAVQDLARNTDDPAQAQILNQLVELVDCQGYDGAEVQMCSQVVEFWETFTEYAIDELFSDEGTPAWIDTAKKYIVSALEHGWAKIRFPSSDVVASWDSEIRTDFKALRRDLQDLVQASFTLLGLPIFETFAHLAMDALNRQAWSDVEAALYCLNALSDSVAANIAADHVLSKVFGSQLFAGSISTNAQLPVQAQQTALDTLTNYTAFFERQHEYIPGMLAYLFQCLSNPALAYPAAKAIFSTCSSCRKRLVGEIGSFLKAYQDLEEDDANVKEKIIGAIAMVIREIPQGESQLKPLSELLRYVEKDVAVVGEALAAGQIEEALAAGICALRCLVGIGKALQAPDEITIDLEADSEAKDSQTAVWASPPGFELRTRIVRVLQATTTSLNLYSDITEAACQVLRTGYKETEPGLFVLPPNVTVDLLEYGFRAGLGSPSLNYLLDAASAMLSRRHYAPADAMSAASSRLFQIVLEYVGTRNNEPTHDPEVAASCLDLMGKLIPHYFATLFQPQTLNALPGFFIFSLRSLAAPEVIPKRAAASLWANIIQKHELPSGDLQTKLTIVLHEFGPQLAHILVRNIAGEAARSELDMLAEPLKKLVFAQPNAKAWLQDALMSATFPSPKVGESEKRVWLQRIMNLRGARGTNQAIKEFWMACRGTSLALTS